MVMCRGQGADLHMAQLMPLPLTISCCSKSRLVLPSWFYLAHTGGPRQNPEGRKMVVVVVVVVVVTYHLQIRNRLYMHNYNGATE